MNPGTIRGGHRLINRESWFARNLFPVVLSSFGMTRKMNVSRRPILTTIRTRLSGAMETILRSMSRGAIEVHGRSDSTLNPGGVRIGTGELYGVVDAMVGVADSIAVSLEDSNGDPVIVLLVQLDTSYDVDLTKASSRQHWEKVIRQHIRSALTPRHVPKFIEFVTGVPYTRSGKKVEVAARLALKQLPVVNVSALLNPDVLEQYQAIGKQLSDKLQG